MSNWDTNNQKQESSIGSKIESIGIAVALGLFLGVIIFAGYLFLNIDKHSSELNFAIPLAITVGLWIVIPLGIYISNHMKNGKKMNALITGLLALVAVVFIFSFISAVTKAANEPSSTRGDGINTCKNCGRRGVFAIGLCEPCADGFSDWYDRTY